MSRKAGRPIEQTDARERLLNQAKNLFCTMPYEKVSTRLLSEKAGVNAAMIRYYFGNKEGLFEAMLYHVMAPVVTKAKEHALDNEKTSIVDVFRTHFQIMRQDPQFPRMLFRIMSSPSSEVQRQVTEKLFDLMIGTLDTHIVGKVREQSAIRDDLDIKKCKLTIISMMIFPFIAPKTLLDKNDIELNDTFLDELFHHNIEVLTSGILKRPDQNKDIN